LGNIDGALGIIVLLLLTLGGGINTALSIGAPLSHHLNSWRSRTATIFSDNDTGRNTDKRLPDLWIEENLALIKSSVNAVHQRQLLHLAFGCGNRLPLLLDPVGYGQRWPTMVVMAWA